MTHEAQISCELAYDSNARRQQSSAAVEGDLLAYLFLTGRVDAHRPRSQLSLLFDGGAKRFATIRAEDTLVGRLTARRVRAPRPGWFMVLDASYKDKLHRGDHWERVEDDPDLACAPPDESSPEGYRCNRREYRQGLTSWSTELRRTSWSVGGRVGASVLDYKPNRQFSYAGPDASMSVTAQAGERNAFRVHAAASLRFYHPGSVTYALLPPGDGPGIQEIAEPRLEQVFTGGVSWRYRGPAVLSTSLTVASSHNNGYGMDVVRGRAELAAAMRVWQTTLVASAAFQLAHYPEGNVFRQIALLADEDERQNSLALQVTHPVTDKWSLVLKGQAYANEFSGDTMPFRRQVLHGGLRWSS